MENLRAVWYGFRQSGPIFLRAFLIALVGIILWSRFHDNLYRLFGITPGGRTVDDLGSDLISFTPAMLYTTLVGFTLYRIMGQVSRLKTAIATLNALMFLEERDRRTPPLIHVMMICNALLITFMHCLYTYSSVRLGVFVIGTFIFISALIFLGSIELDNPFTGIWKIQDTRKIPNKWMDMTIYDILKGDVEHIGNPHFPQANQLEQASEKAEAEM